MFKLSDAVWTIDLQKEIRGEILRQLTDIIQFEPSVSNKVSMGLNIVVSSSDKIGTAGADDHIIDSFTSSGNLTINITGKTEKGAAYGVFSFLEELGYYFLPERTLRPVTGRDTSVPKINRTYKTTNKWRGLFVSFCMVSTSIMSLEDFSMLFDNMLRMKLNRIIFYPFENEPLVDYEFKGERKMVGDISRPESGYFSYGKHWTGSFNVDEIEVGREKFGSRKRVAPMEFQDVSSSDEALNKGKEFLNSIIIEAEKRQIRVWLSFLPQFVSMNMAKYLKPMPRKNLHWSALVSCTDPVVKEINAARIRNIVESYPDLEGVFVGIPEGFYEDPYKESEDYINSKLPGYEKALELQKKYWGEHWPGDELQRKHIEADIAFSKVAVETLEELGKYNISTGLLTVCKAYLLTKLHELLPKDVSFCDIESRSLWTHGGAPLFLFKRMEGRECSIIPRITDDGSQAGMQFNLNLYHKDGYCRSSVENGTVGLMMQTLFINGAGHNIKYLARGLWDPDINPDDFYDEYLSKLYGKSAAASIKKAYKILEDNEEFMGGRGAANMPWNHVPPEIAVLRGFMDFDDPFGACPVKQDFLMNSAKRAAIYKMTVISLRKAAEIFEESENKCIPSGKQVCKYMAVRTRAYMYHLETLVMLFKVYSAYAEAFAKGNVNENISALYKDAQKAYESSLKAAGLFEECVSHTTDLAPLWMMNSSMVMGTKVLIEFLQNILAYHEGKEYWKHVDWDKLFGSCPYPAHGIKIKPEDAIYEPG